MKNNLPLLLLLLVTSGLIPATAASPSPADQAAIVQAVLAANAALTDASNRLDTAAFFAGIVDSGETRIIQDGKLFLTRAEAMAAVRLGSQGIAKLGRRFTDSHVTVLGPDVALLTATGSSTVTLQDGRTFSDSFAVSLLFVLRDGRWMLFHGHFSLPAAAP